MGGASHLDSTSSGNLYRVIHQLSFRWWLEAFTDGFSAVACVGLSPQESRDHVDSFVV